MNTRQRGMLALALLMLMGGAVDHQAGNTMTFIVEFFVAGVALVFFIGFMVKVALLSH